MTHGVTGIDWKHYKHPLPEHVYDIYMQYWQASILQSNFQERAKLMIGITKIISRDKK